MSPRRAAGVTLLALAAASLALAGRHVLAHEAARTDYEAHAADGVDAPGYDPSRSDARYDAVIAALEASAPPAWAAGALLALGLAALLSSRAGAGASPPADGPPPRGLLAPDLLALAVGLALAALAPRVGGASHAALGLALRPTLAGATLGLLVGLLAAGRPLGARLRGVEVARADGRPPGVGLAAAALLLALLTLPVTLVTRSAPALTWAGLRVGRSTSVSRGAPTA